MRCIWSQRPRKAIHHLKMVRLPWLHSLDFSSKWSNSFAEMTDSPLASSQATCGEGGRVHCESDKTQSASCNALGSSTHTVKQRGEESCISSWSLAKVYVHLLCMDSYLRVKFLLPSPFTQPSQQLIAGRAAHSLWVGKQSGWRGAEIVGLSTAIKLVSTDLGSEAKTFWFPTKRIKQRKQPFSHPTTMTMFMDTEGHCSCLKPVLTHSNQGYTKAVHQQLWHLQTFFHFQKLNSCKK